MMKIRFELLDVFDCDLVSVPVGRGPNRHYLLGHIHWCILRLFQYFRQTLPASELSLSCLIEVGTKLSEGLQGAKLRQVESQCSGDLLHGFNLCRAADSRNAIPDVNSWSKTTVE